MALALWGANAGTKAIFDALNIIYKEREKRSFVQADAAVAGYSRLARSCSCCWRWQASSSCRWCSSSSGFPDESGTALLTLLRWPLLYLRHPLRAGVPLPIRPKPDGAAVAMGDLGERDRRRYLDCGLAAAVLVCRQFRHLQCHLRIARGRDRLHGVDVALDHRGPGGRARSTRRWSTRPRKDTTEGRPKPMGARGAQMADEVGEARA